MDHCSCSHPIGNHDRTGCDTRDFSGFRCGCPKRPPDFARAPDQHDQPDRRAAAALDRLVAAHAAARRP